MVKFTSNSQTVKHVRVLTTGQKGDMLGVRAESWRLRNMGRRRKGSWGKGVAGQKEETIRVRLMRGEHVVVGEAFVGLREMMERCGWQPGVTIFYPRADLSEKKNRLVGERFHASLRQWCRKHIAADITPRELAEMIRQGFIKERDVKLPKPKWDGKGVQNLKEEDEGWNGDGGWTREEWEKLA